MQFSTVPCQRQLVVLLALTFYLFSNFAIAKKTLPTKSQPTTNTDRGELAMSHLDFLNPLRRKYSHQPTFLQSVEEIAQSLVPLFEDPKDGTFYKKAFIAMTEPERTISFRVAWMDDKGVMQINRGWRVEFSR